MCGWFSHILYPNSMNGFRLFHRSLVLLFGLITLTIASYYAILWVVLHKSFEGSFEGLKVEYLEYYPSFISNGLSATLFNIFLLLFSLLSFGYIYKRIKNQYVKSLSLVLMVVGGIFLSWYLFTLM